MKVGRLLGLASILALATASCSGDDSSTPSTDAAADGAHPGTGGSSGTGGSTVTDAAKSDATQEAAADTGNGDATNGDASADGGADADADAAQPDETAKLNDDQIEQAVVAVDSRALNVLPGIKGLLNTFIEDDPTLDLGKTDAENATLINERINTLNETYCGGTAIIKNINTPPSVEADFPTPCTINELTLTGKVKATVSKLSSPVGVKVQFTIAPYRDDDTLAVIAPFTINGLELTGTVTVQTTDLHAYPTSATLAITDVGTLTFEGTGKLEGLDGGSRPDGTISGTGTIDPAGGDGGVDAGLGRQLTRSDGWGCTQQGKTEYTLTELSRTLGQCYAHSGNVLLTKAYSCQKVLPNRTLAGQATSKGLVEWLSTTPVDTKVKVTLSSTVGDASTINGTAKLVPLPWTCPVQPTPEPQPEAGPDATHTPDATPHDATTHDVTPDATIEPDAPEDAAEQG